MIRKVCLEFEVPDDMTEDAVIAALEMPRLAGTSNEFTPIVACLTDRDDGILYSMEIEWT